MIRVQLVAPGLALRVGLRELLSADPGIVIADEAADLEQLSGPDQEGDVLLLAAAPGEDLPDAIQSLELPVLLLTDDPDLVRALFELSSQAWGALPLNASEEELGTAVRALAEGLVVGAPILMNGLSSQPRLVELNGQAALVEPLTAREIEVLQRIALGLANKQIAVALEISEHTVKFHLSSIYTKLGATNRTEAVNLALRKGLIGL